MITLNEKLSLIIQFKKGTLVSLILLVVNKNFSNTPKVMEYN